MESKIKTVISQQVDVLKVQISNLRELMDRQDSNHANVQPETAQKLARLNDELIKLEDFMRKMTEV